MKPIRFIGWIAGCLAAMSALSGGVGVQAQAEDALSDDGKRLKIEAMYRDYKQNFAAVTDIAPAEAMELLRAGRAVFVDVREEHEQKVSMLPGAVTEQEFLQYPERYGDKVVIGYCTISYRSGVLAKRLNARGIAMVNLEGGLLAWVHAGGRVYDRAGETRRIHVYGRKWNLGPKDYEALW